MRALTALIHDEWFRATDEPGSRHAPVRRGELSGVTLTGNRLALSHPPIVPLDTACAS
jgi:hypothetical protein